MQRMTPAEALQGRHASSRPARSAWKTDGSLEAGKSADFAVIDAPDVEQWLYHLRANACVRTVIGGATVWAAL